MNIDENTIKFVSPKIVNNIIVAYVSNNRVAIADLLRLITVIHTAFNDLLNKCTAVEPEPEKLTPTQIRKSITQDALVSFIDGKRYKTLKRHLTTQGLTPDAYRAQFGLPADYPMVASSYSEKRAALALSLGLGKKPA